MSCMSIKEGMDKSALYGVPHNGHGAHWESEGGREEEECPIPQLELT